MAWTRNKFKFFIYKNPIIKKLSLKKIKMGKSANLLIYSDSTQNFRNSLRNIKKIFCRFNGIGTYKALYLNPTTISCVIPKKLPILIKYRSQYFAKLLISLNGQNYYDSKFGILFTGHQFKSTEKSVGIILIVLVIVLSAILLIYLHCSKKK